MIVKKKGKYPSDPMIIEVPAVCPPVISDRVKVMLNDRARANERENARVTLSQIVDVINYALAMAKKDARRS